MLQLIEEHHAHFEDIVAVKLAAFFHIVTYDPAQQGGTQIDLAEAFFSWNTSLGQPVQLHRAEKVRILKLLNFFEFTQVEP